MRIPTRLALVLLFVVVAIGVALMVFALSGGTRTNITGTITRDGKPLDPLPEGGNFLVLFVPENRGPNDDPVLAEVDAATGTFRIPEIRSGTYLVAIHLFDARNQDALHNKFDPVHSPLRARVTDDNQVIDIDLPKDLPR